MPRTVSEARLQERSARARLQPRHHPYWRAISEGRHIGYYSGKRGGSWVARCRLPDGKEYLTKALGEADDNFPADGVAILNWTQALEVALEWFDYVRIGGKAGIRYTVGDALDDYLENFTGKSLKKTRHTIEKAYPTCARRATRMRADYFGLAEISDGTGDTAVSLSCQSQRSRKAAPR